MSERTVWIWAAIGVAVGVVGGVAAWAPNGFMAQGSRAVDTAAVGTPLNIRSDVPAAVTAITAAPDPVAVDVDTAPSAVAGAAARAPNGFLPQGSDAADAVAAGTPLKNARSDVPVTATPAATAAPVSVAVAVGAAPSAPVIMPVVADRFKLVGVTKNGNEQMAFITIDGNPAQMFRLGETVVGDVVVRDVSERGASLGPREGGAAMALEISNAPPPTGWAPSAPGVSVRRTPP